jgi:hypothetical protein
MESPLRVWRVGKGMSQRELAATCGVPAQVLSNAERGWSDVPLAVKGVLAGAMDQEAYQELLSKHGKWMDETRRLSAEKLTGGV